MQSQLLLDTADFPVNCRVAEQDSDQWNHHTRDHCTNKTDKLEFSIRNISEACDILMP